MNTELAHNNNNTFKKETKIIENLQSIKISTQLLYELVEYYSKTKNTYYELTILLCVNLFVEYLDNLFGTRT